MCYFGKLDVVTKVKLLKSYCISFYGCELWNLWDDKIEDFVKAWRQGQRSVWKLPYNTHRRFLPLFDSIPVEDEICRRFLSFIHKWLFSECRLVQYVVKHGLLYGGMFSLCGRNALRCANRFSFTVGDIFRSQFNANVVRKQCMAKSVNDISDVCMIIELVCLRDNIFSL